MCNEVKLFTFQNLAVADLEKKLALAFREYAQIKEPQAISFRAPTGSGKTIIMSALMEAVFQGTADYAPQP